MKTVDKYHGSQVVNGVELRRLAAIHNRFEDSIVAVARAASDDEHTYKVRTINKAGVYDHEVYTLVGCEILQTVTIVEFDDEAA